VQDAAVTAGGRAVRSVVYLHGFASSARSTKAGFFADRLRPHAIAVTAPDLNLPDFRSLTMTRMLGQVHEALAAVRDRPTAVVGSSLGGALAVLAASSMPALVDRLVLLAPAVMLARPGHHLLPPDRVDAWRQKGVESFFHFAYGEDRPLDYAFYRDTLKYDAFAAAFSQPALVFQGIHDTSVAPESVEAFSRGRANVRLRLLDDDHQLVKSLQVIWEEVEPFLGLSPDPPSQASL
jgi:pimeloyl-ACP methyl ester carboxylesterase